MDVEKYKYTFTVFTPTYNRGHTLDKVFNSLMKQTFKDFEWLIIDDGSDDNTKDIVNKFKTEAWFSIRYYYKKNGGKHTAYNKALSYADGELFLTFDSDDSCTVDALKRFKYHWDNIKDKENYFSVTSLCMDKTKTIVGDSFPSNIFDSNSIELSFRYNISGEKWGFVKTDLAKKYLFKEYENEKFISESSVWFEISKIYNVRYINEPLRLYEVNNDSLSIDTISLRKNSLNGTMYSYLKQYHLDIPFRYKLKAIINCFRFMYHSKSMLLKCIKQSNKWILIPAMLIGYIMYKRDAK